MATQVSKLNYVDSKLGAPTGGQQTTRIVYNTQSANGNNVVDFFKSFNGQTLGQTNLTQGKLDASESMVIKTISFYKVDNTGSSLRINGIQNFVLSVVVGNQTVVKDLPMVHQNGVSGQPFDRLHDASLIGQANLLQNGQSEVRLLTDIVIPPQTEFSVRLQGSSSLGGADTKIVCVLSGYGKIFSAGASF